MSSKGPHWKTALVFHTSKWIWDVQIDNCVPNAAKRAARDREKGESPSPSQSPSQRQRQRQRFTHDGTDTEEHPDGNLLLGNGNCA